MSEDFNLEEECHGLYFSFNIVFMSQVHVHVSSQIGVPHLTDTGMTPHEQYGAWLLWPPFCS